MATVTIYGTFLNADMTPATSGVVRFTPTATAYTGPEPIALTTTGPVDAEVGPDGTFSVDLIPSDDAYWLGPDGEPIAYEIETRIPGHRESFRAMILTHGHHDFSQIEHLT